MVADYLSRLDSGKSPVGVDDEFPDAALFTIFASAPVHDDLRIKGDLPRIPWTWYKELYHFVDSGLMPPWLSKDQRRRLALQSRNLQILVGELYYQTINNVLL